MYDLAKGPSSMTVYQSSVCQYILLIEISHSHWFQTNGLFFSFCSMLTYITLKKDNLNIRLPFTNDFPFKEISPVM